MVSSSTSAQPWKIDFKFAISNLPFLPLACEYASDFGLSTPSGEKLRKMQREKVETLKALLQNGVDVNAPNAEGILPLEYLLDKDKLVFYCNGHYWEYIYLLYEHGARFDIRNSSGYRADELLLEYLKNPRTNRFCKLSQEQIEQLKSKAYKTAHQYSKDELQRLVNRIMKCVEEMQRIPEEVWLSDSVYHSSYDEALKAVSKKADEIKRHVELLGEALNKCGRELESINSNKRNHLNRIVNRLTAPSPKVLGTTRFLPMFYDQLKKVLQRLISSKTESDQGHLVPTSFYGNRKRIQRMQSAKSSVEILSAEEHEIKRRVQDFLINHDYKMLNSIEKEIVLYLRGFILIEELGLTSENGRQFLVTAKIFDLVIAGYRNEVVFKFSNSTYELRTRVLELCSPLMSTCEAYTKTLDPKKIKDRSYLKNPAHWVPERNRLQSKIIANQVVLAAGLSTRLNHFVTSYWAVRGNTASGKTEAIASDSLFSAAQTDAGEISGSINPDFFKHSLKKSEINQVLFTNNQVHEEGIALFELFKKGLEKSALNASLVIDSRLTSLEDIESKVLKPARKKNGEVLILDLDTSLMTSVNRVLARDPFGKNPCVVLDSIVEGFIKSRECRLQLLELVKTDPAIKYFKLYYTDEAGYRHLVVEKNYEQFKILSEEFLKKSCEIPSYEEIEKLINQTITSDYIDQAILKRDILPSSRPMLERWIGTSISKAMEMHARALPLDKSWKLIQETTKLDQRYGEYSLSPFSPDWLKDYPQIADHLESEHLLHIRGSDEAGRGLTWETNKFNWKLNGMFNPEAKVKGAERGGFQMKVGYFIVPPSKVEKYTSLLMSPAILKELEVKDSEGNLIGYRFFVHPQAYAHYRSLHEDGEIAFVQPHDSEFIGTPTSSYRSWAVRRIKEKVEGIVPTKGSIPFIIKLGVVNTVSNSDRLLTKSDVQRSIHIQRTLDQMKSNTGLSVFKESLGLVLQNIANYPPRIADFDTAPRDSGLIIREFPEELLEGKCKIFSFSALMSLERSKKENQGLCALSDNQELGSLPLIYEIIEATIQKKLVKTPLEFIQRYFIDGYLAVIEQVVFKEGLILAPHGQNLCLILNQDNTPKGFAYRDLEGVSIDIATRGLNGLDTEPFFRDDICSAMRSKEAISKGYIHSFSWFYRYHVFVKLLTTMTNEEKEFFPAPLGAPIQVGHQKARRERNLYFYLKKISQIEGRDGVLKTLDSLSISEEEYRWLIRQLDAGYLSLLSRYFDLEKVQISMTNGALPSAEGGAAGEELLLRHQGFLGRYRTSEAPGNLYLLDESSQDVIDLFKKRVIMAFEHLILDDVKVSSAKLAEKGICFFDAKGEMVAFGAYNGQQEKKWLSGRLLSLPRTKSFEKQQKPSFDFAKALRGLDCKPVRKEKNVDVLEIKANKPSEDDLIKQHFTAKEKIPASIVRGDMQDLSDKINAAIEPGQELLLRDLGEIRTPAVDLCIGENPAIKLFGKELFNAILLYLPGIKEKILGFYFTPELAPKRGIYVFEYKYMSIPKCTYRRCMESSDDYVRELSKDGLKGIIKVTNEYDPLAAIIVRDDLGNFYHIENVDGFEKGHSIVKKL